jgi:AcrR family transcriptional regulator
MEFSFGREPRLGQPLSLIDNNTVIGQPYNTVIESQAMLASMTETRDQLLHAAAEILEDEGLAALSVRKVAARAGGSTMGLYSHFKGKPDVLNALYGAGFLALSKRLEDCKADSAPVSHVLTMVDLYVDFWEQKPGHYDLMFGGLERTFAPSSDAANTARMAYTKLVDAIARCLRDGASDHRAPALAFALWSMVHGILTLRVHLPESERGADKTRSHVKEAVRIFLQGLQFSKEDPSKI